MAAFLKLNIVGFVEAAASLTVLGFVRESWWVFAAAFKWAVVRADLSWAVCLDIESGIVFQGFVKRLHGKKFADQVQSEKRFDGASSGGAFRVRVQFLAVGVQGGFPKMSYFGVKNGLFRPFLGQKT